MIGRRFRTLWAFDQERAERRLDDIFPRGDTTMEQRRFIAAWNSFVRYNTMWEGYDVLRPHYLHAIELLGTGGEDVYEIHVRSTAAHIVSSYIFGEELLSDDESLIRRYYCVASPDDATELAITIASGIENLDEEYYWEAIRALWDWRLNQLENTNDTTEEEHANEIRQFLDCVRDSSMTYLVQEQERIQQSLPIVISGGRHWHRIEEWLADQSDLYPTVAVGLYEVMVDAASGEAWSATARLSRDTNRERIYENAASNSDEALQTALNIANQFAAEGYDMDREFLDANL